MTFVARINLHARDGEHERYREQKERRRAEQEQAAAAREQTQAARNEVMRFYDANEANLRVVLPKAMFLVDLKARMPADQAPGPTWAAARQMLAELHQLVRTEEERKKADERKRRSQAERRRKIDREIRDCEEQIAKLLASPLRDEMDVEILAKRKHIRNLQEQMDMIESFNHE